MKKNLTSALCLLGMLGLPAGAMANDEVTELKQMVEKMNAQMMYMQQRIQQLESEKKQAPSKQNVAQSSSKNDVEVSLSPAPKFKSADGAFEAKVLMFGQTDAVFHNDDTVDHPDSLTIRRARLGLAGKIYHDWGYKFLYEFGSNNNEELQDLFVTYNGFENTQFKIGQFKEAIGLEWQSSSKYWSFMDLPLTATLTPRRSIGASFSKSFNDLRVNLGIYGENANKTRSDDEGYSYDAHLAYAPLHEKGKHFHIGASARYAVPDAASDALTFSAKHETSSSAGNSVTTGSITSIDHTFLGGLEALGIWGPFLLQGEYVTLDVDRDAALSDARFDSYYTQATWMLTGESRNFNTRNHGFTRVVPHDPFSIKEGGIGAWELAARFESLDLTDGSITGGEMDRYVLGVNWYPNSFIRLTTNYSLIDTDENATIANDNTQAVSMRAQVDF